MLSAVSGDCLPLPVVPAQGTSGWRRVLDRPLSFFEWPKHEKHGDPHNVHHGQDTDQEEDGRAWRSVTEVNTTDQDCTI